MAKEDKRNDAVRAAAGMGQPIPPAIASSDPMCGAGVMGESIRRATALTGFMRSADIMGESIRRATALTGFMGSTDIMGESIRKATALTGFMRSTDIMGESIRRATVLTGFMRSADIMGESIRRATALGGFMRSAHITGESIRRATALSGSIGRLSVLDRFQSIGMATAATSISAPNAAAFATVWQSPKISAFAERFLQDAEFNREFLSQIQDWRFEDLEEDLPEGEAVLSAIEGAIESTGLADRPTGSKAIAGQLVEFWASLPAGLRQMIGAFIVGLILLLAEHCLFIPMLHPQEPAAQQRIREQRKLAAYALNELGIHSNAYRITADDHVPVFAYHRRDAPRTGELDLGQTVEVVQKNRNWCEVIWLDPTGRTRGGWVQTRCLRRL